ncbi:hypothetical protein TrLO_g3080 [Triparma laevis f. longispina]|uniref:Uncharacterized protein n=1 Tax=Triparma laevis f. longispina TaxID=1714387 RepID=A0A9W7CIW7_9STRA|nr:hypothetical protein TrLO_g3080 [Triparma laevis f. longispina]
MERYAYYAFRSVLVSFFVDKLLMEESSAISAFMYTSALAYFTPLIGGLLSDAKLGKYTTIVVFSTVYIGGLTALAFGAFANEKSIAFLGLFFIGVGTGGIKPCVSSFGADQLKYTCDSNGNVSALPSSSSEDSMRKYFSAFYFAINVGALISYIFSPVIKHHMGYGLAFLLPALFMLSALVTLIKNKATYAIIKPDSDSANSPVLVIGRILILATSNFVSGGRRVGGGRVASSFLDRATVGNVGITDEQVEDAKDFFRTFRFVLLMPLFWMLFDQQGSAWVLQAKRMKLPSWVEAEQLGVCNTAFVLVLLPIMENKVYPYLTSVGCKPTALRRMGLGMVFASASFVISAFVELAISGADEENSVSVGWQLPQYFVLTVGEIGVSTTGLEFFYEEAPPSMKTASASLFLLTTAVGDVMGGLLYDFAGAYGVNNATLLFFCSILMFTAFAVFVRFAKSYQYRSSETKSDDEEDGDVQMSLVGEGGGNRFDMEQLEGGGDEEEGDRSNNKI